MSHVFFTEIRISDNDNYVGDLAERPTRQRPKLTRKQAEAAWKEEREFFFFSELMRSSTSYRSDALDDLFSLEVKQRKVKAWQAEIEADRQYRDETLRRITDEIETQRKQNTAVSKMEHITEISTGECSCTEGRTQEL